MQSGKEKRKWGGRQGGKEGGGLLVVEGAGQEGPLGRRLQDRGQAEGLQATSFPRKIQPQEEWPKHRPRLEAGPGTWKVLGH